MLTRGIGILLILGTANLLAAQDSLSALQLVSADAAVCIEIPELEKTWSNLESFSPLSQRLLALPPSKRFLESSSFEHWQQFEEKIARATGHKICGQVRSLFARSLVLAVYLPVNEDPQGVLIGEAADAKAVSSALQLWNSLEPESIMTAKRHRSYQYRQRKRRASDTKSLYLASSDRWFAISDQESRIQDVIDRFVMLARSAPPVPVTESINQLPEFTRNRLRLNSPASAYIHINARAWDRSLDEATVHANYPQKLTNIWKHIKTIAVSLDLNQGLVCESIFEPEIDRFPKNWAKLVETFVQTPSWKDRIPDNVLFAYYFKEQLLTLPGSTQTMTPRLTDHSQRYFPNAGQLIWCDLAQLRKQDFSNDWKLVEIVANAIGARTNDLQTNMRKLTPLAGLFDSLFVAGQVNPDYIRVTFGGGLDSQPSPSSTNSN